MSELTSLCLFFLALLKVGVMTGLGPAIGIAVVLEQVSGRAVRHSKKSEQSVANKPVRDFLVRAA